MKSARQARFAIAGLVKRLLDFVAASLLVVILSPVFLALAVGVWLRLGRPIIFKQDRPGLAGEPFTIYKFRSMLDITDSKGNLPPNNQRMTPFGRFIRAASLDELPELWNVIKGDMSLVGPRPLMMWYLPRYNAEQARRHDVKPGITGLAQIGGRNTLSWEEKFAFDIEYVDNHDLGLDISILVRTIGKVLARDGISHRDHLSMPEFLGTDSPDASPEQ